MQELVVQYWWVGAIFLALWLLTKLRRKGFENLAVGEEEITQAIVGAMRGKLGDVETAAIVSTALKDAADGNAGDAAKKVVGVVGDKIVDKLEADTGIDYSKIRAAAGNHPLDIAVRKAVESEKRNAGTRKKIATAGKIVVKIVKAVL